MEFYVPRLNASGMAIEKTSDMDNTFGGAGYLDNYMI